MRYFRKRTLLTLLCAALCLGLLACSGQEIQPEKRIADTLSRLGVADAKLVEADNDPKLGDEGSLLYTSDATQMGYYFDPDSGVLTDIFSYNILGGTYRKQAAASPAPIPVTYSSESREELLLEYARSCVGDNLFGTLELRVDQDQGELHQYTVTESYDGIKTGTTVLISITADGQITMVNVTIGHVFEKAADGRWILAAGDDLIGEDAAIAVARTGLNALDLNIRSVSDDATCKLDAAEDMLVYTIYISFTDENGREREYRAAVNAHTGELWREAVTR